MEEEENDNCSLFGCSSDPYAGLFIGSVVILGVGVYFLNKKKKGACLFIVRPKGHFLKNGSSDPFVNVDHEVVKVF